MLGSMSGSSPTYGFPYPNTTDAPLVPADFEGLADAVDAQIVVTDDAAAGTSAELLTAQADISALQAAGGEYPAGIIQMYGGQSVPAGWMLCDGRALSKAGQYSDLFDAIGYSHGGSGDTFNVPDFGNRYAQGFKAGGDPVGSVGGATSYVLSASQMPSHNHSFVHTHGGYTSSAGTHAHRVGSLGWTSADKIGMDGGGSKTYGLRSNGLNGNDWTATEGSHSHSVATNYQDNSWTSSSGGNAALNISPPHVVVHYIIRY